MGVLSRAIFREVAASAILGTVLFTFVLFLRALGPLFEVLVRGTAPPKTVAYLMALLLPPVLTFSLPVGTLVGVLIGLGRMSADGEITAMRAAGVSARRVVAPVLIFALLATAAAAACSLWFTPFSIRERYRLVNTAIAKQLTAEVQRGVFEEQFTGSNTVLYVGDVIASASSVGQWKKVFIADLTPPEQRSSGGREYADVPKILIAEEALAIPDPATNRLQLSMKNVNTYQIDKNPAIYHATQASAEDQTLAAKPRSEEGPSKVFTAMDTRPLKAEAKKSVEAGVEYHRRFALPLACLLLAIVGIPLGTSSRKAGKSGAFVLTVALAFLYYMALISLTGLAEQGRLSVPVAVWTPDVVFALVGIGLLLGLERPGDRDILSRIRAGWAVVTGAFQSRAQPGKLGDVEIPRIPLLPGVLDTYVLSGFLFWTAALLASLVMFSHVFIFFDLLGDIFATQTPMPEVARYHFFLTPKLIYETAPMAVLVSVLVAFGMLAKNNETIAMRACGVSLYRLSMPVLLAGLTMSGAMFAFDHYYIPEANRIQDGILNKIKGRPVQTYLRPDRKWVFGQPGARSRIFYFKFLDPVENVMIGPNIYELDPKTFRMARHITADSAKWDPAQRQWVFQGAWAWEFEGYRPIRSYQAVTFPEVTETPAYFLSEKKQEQQLNFQELQARIADLQQSGLDTVRMRVQYYRKFSVPLFVGIMTLLAVPFSFLTGNRGAMAGIGVALGVAIAYMAIGRLFAEIGNVNQLPAEVAAWAPDAVFTVAGLYLFARMRS